MLLSQSTTFNDLASLGAAGIMGLMWLWERRSSRTREQQLDEAHVRIMAGQVQLEQLIEVVQANAQAMTRLAAIQDQLVRTLEQGHFTAG